MQNERMNGEPIPATDNTRPAADEPVVDVAAIMRQVRQQISARQGQRIENELRKDLHDANQHWDKVYEPLHLPPGKSPLGRVWDVFRVRMHQEVRSYLDAMIYRQTEFNASVVRILNNLMRRNSLYANAAELELLRDEVIQLRARIRQLEEQIEEKL